MPAPSLSADGRRPRKLWALSDLHLGSRPNRELYGTLPERPDDWIILAGDLGETELHLRLAVEIARERFAKVIWVPGNHELWTVPAREGLPPFPDAGLRGVAKYQRLVDVCRELGALTPEDDYPVFDGEGGPVRLVPLFLGYDYTFRPDRVPPELAIAWAVESGVLCTDEQLLHPDPYPSRQAWCDARVDEAERRLDALDDGLPTVLINHYPLRQAHAVLPRVPRFSIWCGTTRTDDWHRRYNATAVVYGHLHIPKTRVDDGVRFEEVSLGYPNQRRPTDTIAPFLREILPGPDLR